MLKVKNNITIRSRSGLETLESLRNLGYDVSDDGKIKSLYDIHLEDKERDRVNSAREAAKKEKLAKISGEIADYIDDFRHTAAAMLTTNPITFVPGAVWSALNLGYDYMHGDEEGMKRTITEPLMFYGIGKAFGAIPKVAKSIKGLSKGLSKGSNPVSKAVNERVIIPDNTPEFNKAIPHINSAVTWGTVGPFIFPSKE